MTDPINRRQFGQRLAAPAFASADGAWSAPHAMGSPGPANVAKVYVASRVAKWPHPNLDYAREAAGIDSRLAEMERNNPRFVRFSGGKIFFEEAELQKWLEQAGQLDAVLVFDLTSRIGGFLQTLAKSGTPTLLFTRPLTGTGFMTAAQLVASQARMDFLATNDFGELEAYLPLFRTLRYLRTSKVLVIPPSDRARATAAGFSKQFGASFGFPTFQELKATYDSVEVGQAQKEAQQYAKGALRVVEPKPADVVDACRFYLAVQKLLQREKANAITIDCLNGFQAGKLPAYPCVAWSRLNDQGLYGVCEADIVCTMTQILVTSYCGKPGFVSDPTIDTARNEVIHAHCVAPTCLRGFGTTPSPYILRSHMEDEKGVSVQVEMPVGETVTVATFTDPKRLLISTAEVRSNLDHRRGCRTKIITSVADARKMAEGWSGGWHRVIFYGNHVQAVERIGRLAGFQIVREC